MRVASCFTTSRSPETEVINFLERWALHRGLDFSKLRKFGFDIPVSEEQKKYGLRSYEFWVKVPDGIEQGYDGVKIKFVNTAKYAKLRIKNPFDDPQLKMRAGWNMLFDWVASHKVKRENGKETDEDKENYMLEEIVETNDATFIDLYFPME